MSNLLMISGAVVVLITFTILYFAMKSTGSGSVCLPGQHYKCPDAKNWSSDATVGDASCDNTGQWVTDGMIGPGHCAVTCPTGYTPCWNSATGAGTCVSGSTCPCSTDADCKNGGTCDPSKGSDCECPKGYSGTRCETADGGDGTCDAYNCSLDGGACVEGGGCVCKGAGWNPAAPTGSNLRCSECQTGWGPPPGTVGFDACSTNNKVTGFTIPVVSNYSNCQLAYNIGSSGRTTVCQSNFGINATEAEWCDAGGFAADSCSKCSPTSGGSSSNTILCTLKNGYWSTVSQDVANSTPYNNCDTVGCGVWNLPPGYMLPA